MYRARVPIRVVRVALRDSQGIQIPPVPPMLLQAVPRRTAPASACFCGTRTRRPASARGVLCRASSASAKTHAVVVGGGPAGLLAAHLLLEADDKYVVTVHELRGDPRRENPSSSRQYSLGLGARGRFALQVRKCVCSRWACARGTRQLATWQRES